MPSYLGTSDETVATYAYGAGADTAAVIKDTPGKVFSFHITNANAAARYFQLHDKATIPLATEVPQIFFKVPGTSQVTIDSEFFYNCESFATGIGWAISTTAGTFTDSATATEHGVVIKYL